MTEQQQRAANAELARRMGYTVKIVSGKFGLWRCHKPNGESQSVCAHISESQAWFSAPDYFTDPAASRELVTWLAKQEVIIKRRFIANLHPGLSDACVFNDAPIDEDMILEAMTAEPSVIARAACKALGIEVSE